MKLQRLHIKNFKSIVDLEIVEPNPFTVFVGPNGSGKSNIFEALEFASSMSLENDFDIQEKIQEQFGGLGRFLNKKYSDSSTAILYQFSNQEGALFMCIPKNNELIEVIRQVAKNTEQQQKDLNDLLIKFAKEKGKEIPIEWLHSEKVKRTNKLLSSKYDSVSFLLPIDKDSTESFNEGINNINFPKIINSFFNINNKPEFEQLIDWFSRIFVGKRIGDRTKYRNHLRTDASNLEKVLVRILKDDNKREEIIEWLQLFIPEFENIEFRKNQINGRTELQIFEKFSTEPFDKNLLSDGTYNILALLTAVYQSDEPQFLCIEEPENGLTPYVIEQFVEIFRNACQEKGHYIWLNTHSPTLVRQLRADELIIVDKKQGATQIKQFKGKDFHGMKMDEAWLTNALGGGLSW